MRMTPLLGSVGIALFVAAGCSSAEQDPTGGAGHGGGLAGAGGGPTSVAGHGGSPSGPGGAGGADSSCTYMGQTYPAGASFPDAPPGLACETCYCISGSVHCSDVGCWCFLGAADAVETLTFGQNGGLVGYRDSATLATNSYTYSRTPDGATTPSASCMPALPPCLTGQMLDINDIRNDLADPDVRLAFATTPPLVFGVDSRRGDGTILEVKLWKSGSSFLVGPDCPPSSSSCRPIPPGVAKLVADLQALNEQQLADPSCAFARAR